MPVYKDINHKGTTPWYAKFQYTDTEGKKKTKIKRGFRTEKDAKAFEKKFLSDISSDKEYFFEQVVDFYLKTKSNKIKLSSLMTKESIFQKYILPYFKGKDIRDITTSDLTRWQNKVLFAKDENGERLYKDTYIKTINTQLRGLFNFAVRNGYIDYSENPILKLESVGSKESDRDFITWSREEFSLFLRNISDYEDAYYAFMILFYTGIRKGELLALTVEDFNYEKRTLSINKTFSIIKGKEVVTSPKTKNSKRTVMLPDFVSEAINTYINLFYKPSPTQRLFNYNTGKFLVSAMEIGCSRTGLPKIRIHDIRHSHITYLQSLVIPSVEIAKRVGHKNLNMTMHYSHSTEQGQMDIITKLEKDGEISNDS